MLILNRLQVEALLDVDALIDALASAMADLSAGRASMPDRVAALVPEHEGFLAAMPGFVPSGKVLMSKLVSLFPHNAGTGLPTHQAVIAGHPGNGCAGTIARPGDVPGHADPPDPVAGRDYAKASALAAELSDTLQTDAQAVETYRQALQGAGIACATTHAAEPVIRRAWLTAGVHVTSVGYGGREIDAATVADALVCVESRRSALAPFPSGSNDLLMPIRDGVITADHVHAELGELVAGIKPGRQGIGEEIVL